MGLTAGPDNPPVPLARVGRRAAISILMAVMVLMSEMASAPDEAAARAVGRTSPLLGESFIMRGSVVARRTADVTLATASGLAPRLLPLLERWGRRRSPLYLLPLAHLPGWRQAGQIP